MEQYIPKAAVVAEIKGLIRANELYLSEPKTDEIRFQKVGAYSVLNDLLHSIDTLETKEVDLEKEVTNWWNDRYKKINDDYEFGKYNGHYMENSTIISLAKHFFEVGLRTHIPVIYKPTETDVYKLGLKAHKG